MQMRQNISGEENSPPNTWGREEGWVIKILASSKSSKWQGWKGVLRTERISCRRDYIRLD